jgi:hypothetical protein
MSGARWGLVAATAVSGCADMGAPNTASSPIVAARRGSCARPTDQNGHPMYQAVSGSFVERRMDPSGARLVLLKVPSSAADEGFAVTRDIYDALGSVQSGRPVILLAYVGSALAGTNPPYSCAEW